MMGKFGSFVFGVIVGCAVMYGSLHYHIVRAADKVHFIPKLSSTVSETYVDIRNFGIQEWNDHRGLAAAIVKAGKPELIQGVAIDSLQNVTDAALNAFGVPLETTRGN